MASTLPSLAKRLSSQSNQCTSLSSKIKFKNTNSKKIPPNAEISAWCAISLAEYSSGLYKAKLITSIIPRSAVTATMTIGKTNRIPNTAIRIPTVKNIFFQNSSQPLRTEALTTALSKDNEISMTAKIAVIERVAIMPPIPPCEYPHHAAIAKAIAVKIKSK